jgi:coenzyme F420 biosynthesis associated uncharacterized protein
VLAERLAVAGAGRSDRSRADAGRSEADTARRRADAAAAMTRLDAMAADAAVRVAAYTGLQPQAPLPPPEAISRREWVAANVATMRRMLDPVLARAGEGLGVLRPAVSLTASVVATTEVGVVLGFLAQRVLGQYELVMLDESVMQTPPRLLFVAPNLAAATRTLDAPAEEFLTWVTLHEVTHAVQFGGVSWLQGYLAGLVAELMSSAELRLDASRTARSGPGSGTALGSARAVLDRLPSRAELRRSLRAAREGDVIGIFASPGERATIDRVQAAMAVIEGHAEHVMDAVAPELLPSLPRLRAALDRRRQSSRGLARVVGRLLGLELKMRQYEQGKFFIDAIERAAGRDALVAVFSSPEALPTLAEIADPPSWVARMGLDGRPSEITGS